MTAERCPRCDRAECRVSVLADQVSVLRNHEKRRKRGMLEAAQRECEAHAVDWRARAIAAEASDAESLRLFRAQRERREAAESERDGLRAMLAGLIDAAGDLRDGWPEGACVATPPCRACRWCIFERTVDTVRADLIADAPDVGRACRAEQSGGKP